MKRFSYLNSNLSPLAKKRDLNNMSDLIKKLGAEKVKHHLRVDIHYLRAKLSESCSVYFEVKRGKHMKKVTQTLNYSADISHVQFDSSSEFDITMHKKGKKYVKKYFSIKLYEVQGNSSIENGRVKIDFSQIPVLKKPISKREVGLQHCSDKSAVISITVSLEPLLGKPAKDALVRKSVEKITPNKLEGPQNSTSNSADISNVEDESIKKENDSHKLDASLEENEYKDGSDDEDISSRMSFSDLIVHPRDSELDSESSSSEEEYKELPPDRLIAHSIPKVSKDYVTPNQNSKALQIMQKEEKAGITTKREGTTCANCITF